MENETLKNNSRSSIGEMDELPLKEIFGVNVVSHKPDNIDVIKNNMPTISFDCFNNHKENVYEDIEQNDTTFSKRPEESLKATSTSKTRPSLLLKFDPLFETNELNQTADKYLNVLTNKLSNLHIDEDDETILNFEACSKSKPNECKFISVDDTLNETFNTCNSLNITQNLNVTVDVCSGDFSTSENVNSEINNTSFQVETNDNRGDSENTNAGIFENQLELSKSTSDTNVFIKQIAQIEVHKNLSTTFCEHERSNNSNHNSPRNSIADNSENNVDVSTSSLSNSVNIFDTNISLSSAVVDDIDNTFVVHSTEDNRSKCSISNQNTSELENCNFSAENFEKNTLENSVHSTEDNQALNEEGLNISENDNKHLTTQCNKLSIKNEEYSNQSGHEILNQSFKFEGCNFSTQDLEKNILENVDYTEDNHKLYEEAPNTFKNDDKLSSQCTNVNMKNEIVLHSCQNINDHEILNSSELESCKSTTQHLKEGTVDKDHEPMEYLNEDTSEKKPKSLKHQCSSANISSDGVSLNCNQTINLHNNLNLTSELEHINDSLEKKKLENTLREPADLNLLDKNLTNRKFSSENDSENNQTLRMENIESPKITELKISNEFIHAADNKEALELNSKVLELEKEIKHLQLSESSQESNGKVRELEEEIKRLQLLLSECSQESNGKVRELEEEIKHLQLLLSECSQESNGKVRKLEEEIKLLKLQLSESSQESNSKVRELEEEKKHLTLQLSESSQELNGKVRELEEEIKLLKLQLSESQENCTKLVLKVNQNNETFEQNITELNKKLTEKNDSKELQELIKDLQLREEKLKSELSKSQSEIKHYKNIMEEFEKNSTRELLKFEKMKIEHAEVNKHLTNLEMAFSDVHQKYERCKTIINGYKTNEDALSKSLTTIEGQRMNLFEKYENFKTYAKDEIQKCNKEINNVRQQHLAEINKLTTTIKRLEIKNSSLQELLDQKNKECVALSVLYDEVTGNV